jgi:hypothetical protein
MDGTEDAQLFEPFHLITFCTSDRKLIEFLKGYSCFGFPHHFKEVHGYLNKLNFQVFTDRQHFHRVIKIICKDENSYTFLAV